MSGKATGWVLRHGPEPRGHRTVLTAVADAADVNGENARIGWQKIAERSAYSRRRVVTLLAELISDGWLEVTQAGGPGRGRVTVYRLPKMTLKGAIPATEKVQPATVKGATSDMEKVQPAAQLAEVIPLPSLDGKTQTVDNESTLGADVASLCEILAGRVAQQQHGRRPPITAAWRNDMRLLLERGPLGQDRPEKISRAKVHATIDFVFDEMSEPDGNSNFCWADQVRSPSALRRHWHKMARSAENKLRARRSRTAQAIDRLNPGSGSSPLPVHLLPNHDQRKALP